MDWSSFNTTAIIDQVSDVLLIVLPVAIGLFALFYALRFAKKVLDNFLFGDMDRAMKNAQDVIDENDRIMKNL